MDSRSIIKKAVKFGAGCCVSATVGFVLKQNIAIEKTFDKIVVGIGSGVIGMMVGDMAEQAVSNQIDDIYEMIDKMKPAKTDISIPEDSKDEEE